MPTGWKYAINRILCHPSIWPGSEADSIAIVKPRVDAVIVGMGWTGAIMAKELTDAGLHVVVLERGPDRDTQPDFSYPRVVDELEGSIHRKYLQSLAKETVTARHSIKDTAVPYRQMGSFK